MLAFLAKSYKVETLYWTLESNWEFEVTIVEKFPIMKE